MEPLHTCYSATGDRSGPDAAKAREVPAADSPFEHDRRPSLERRVQPLAHKGRLNTWRCFQNCEMAYRLSLRRLCGHSENETPAFVDPGFVLQKKPWPNGASDLAWTASTKSRREMPKTTPPATVSRQRLRLCVSGTSPSSILLPKRNH